MDAWGIIVRARVFLGVVFVPFALLYMRYALEFSWRAVALVGVMVVFPVVAARIAMRLLQEPPRRHPDDLGE